MFLTALIFSLTLSVTQNDWGQDKIRESWATQKSDEANPRAWKQRYGLIDVAEDYWANTKSTSAGFVDPYAVHDRFVQSFKSQPARFNVWIPALLNDWVSRANRPFDALPVWISTLQFLLIAAFLAGVICNLFYLSVWANPISHDFRAFTFSGPAVRFALFSSLIVAIFLKAVPIWFLITSALMLTYSRSAFFGLLTYTVAALVFIAPGAKPILEEAAEVGAIAEALQDGRTRMEYSQSALENLGPDERAHWAFLNRDFSSSREWLNQAEDSVSTRNLRLLLKASEDPSKSLLEDFQNLYDSDPAQSVLAFNLSQVLTKSQNLIAADRLRGSITPNLYANLLRQSEESGLWLLPLYNKKASEIFLERLRSGLNFSDKRTDKQPVFFMIQLLLIAVVLIGALGRRASAAGICEHTGEATPHRNIHESSLYVTLKGRGTKPTRQQLESAIRSYQVQRIDWAQQWSWLIPEFHHLIRTDSAWRSFLWLLAVVGAVLFGLSSKHLNQLYSFLQLSPIELLTRSPLFLWSFILAGILYLISLKLSYQRIKS